MNGRQYVSYAYSLGDAVHIIELDRPGLITGLMAESGGASYRVVYWNDGRRYAEWMHAWELRTRDADPVRLGAEFVPDEDVQLVRAPGDFDMGQAGKRTEFTHYAPAGDVVRIRELMALMDAGLDRDCLGTPACQCTRCTWGLLDAELIRAGYGNADTTAPTEQDVPAASPHLERYRAARADIAEMERDRLRGSVTTKCGSGECMEPLHHVEQPPEAPAAPWVHPTLAQLGSSLLDQLDELLEDSQHDTQEWRAQLRDMARQIREHYGVPELPGHDPRTEVVGICVPGDVFARADRVLMDLLVAIDAGRGTCLVPAWQANPGLQADGELWVRDLRDTVGAVRQILAERGPAVLVADGADRMAEAHDALQDLVQHVDEGERAAEPLGVCTCTEVSPGSCEVCRWYSQARRIIQRAQELLG